MKSTKIGAVGVAAAIGLLLAALAYTGAQGSTTSRLGATKAEAAIARTDIVHRLEAALGRGFGGVWFVSATAQLHVGVTSPATRHAAEVVAARAGLEKNVTETPVRSTWAQLRAAQGRWDKPLNDLFEAGEVATALSARRNSIEVELGSNVPADRQIALERRAGAAPVGVEVSLGSAPRQELVRQLRCVTFKATAAHCERPIVAGVTLKGPKGAKGAEPPGEEETEAEEIEEEPGSGEYEAGKQRKECTAGPLAITRNPGSLAERTKTYLLTAGHCINPKKGGGGVGEKWAALDPGGTEHEIGPAIEYLNTTSDIGVIEVNTSYWALANNPTPVVPTIASWNPAAESTPVPVILEISPVEGTQTCISGQEKGKVACGKILTTSRKLKPKGAPKGTPQIENLVEVSGVTTVPGDSGAPWFAEAQFKEAKPTGYVEGVHAGRNTGNNNALVQPLDVGFAKLDNESGLDLELLKRSNARRLPGFVSAEYPSTASAKNTSAEDLFTASGLKKGRCTEDSFDGEITEPGEAVEANAIKLTPTYGKCEQTEGEKLKFDIEFGTEAKPCYYLFTAAVGVPEGETLETQSSHAQVHIKCGEGEKVRVKLTLGGIKVTCLEIPPQTLTGVHYTDKESGGTDHIEISETIEGLEYTEKGACGSETRKDGTLQGHITLKGSKGEKPLDLSYDEP